MLNIVSAYFRYDHLSEVLTAILDEKPNNSVGKSQTLLMPYYSSGLYLWVSLTLNLSLLLLDLFENLWQEKSKSKVAAEPAVVVRILAICKPRWKC